MTQTITYTSNLKALVAPYADERAWLALSEDQTRVVGKGKTIKEAIEEAKSRGEKHPVLIQALPKYSGFAPAHF